MRPRLKQKCIVDIFLKVQEFMLLQIKIYSDIFVTVTCT